MVNLAATWLLARADRRSLNVEGAFQHVLNDLFAFVATLVAGLVIVLTDGLPQADAIAAARGGGADGEGRRTACCATAHGSSSRPHRGA